MLNAEVQARVLCKAAQLGQLRHPRTKLTNQMPSFPSFHALRVLDAEPEALLLLSLGCTQSKPCQSQSTSNPSLSFFRVLDAELEALMLSKAAQLGLPAAWVSRLDRLDQERRQVLRVRSCVANSHAAQVRGWLGY